jgi:hypothetical protein
MDLSKLPKLSQTPAPPPPPPLAATSDAPTAAPVVTPQAVELFCQCGAPVVAGTNFCAHCGASYRDVLRGSGGTPTRDASATGRDAPAGLWVEAFFSVAMGLFLMMMAPNGIKCMWATIQGKAFTPYPNGPDAWVDYEDYRDPQTEVISRYFYRDRFEHFWSDRCVTMFALALILEGIVLAFVRNRWVVLASAGLIIAVTLLNLWYVVASMTRVSPITRQPYGLPNLSALAVIFGVVMAGYQLVLFNDLRRAKR